MFLDQAYDIPVFSSTASYIPDIKESETNLGKSTNSLNLRCLRHSLACDMLGIVTLCTVHYWFGKQLITMEVSLLDFGIVHGLVFTGWGVVVMR